MFNRSVIVFVMCFLIAEPIQGAPSVASKEDSTVVIDKTPLRGSSPMLRERFMGRCLDFLELYKDTESHDKSYNANPAPRCEEIWMSFFKAWGKKNICTVTGADYEEFFQKTGSYIPLKDKVLFWTAVKDLAAEYAKHGQRAFSLADTLTGYLVTDLNWCGDKSSPDGIRYKNCPRCRIRSDDKVTLEGFEVFWARASELFAKRATGEVRHLVTATALHWKTNQPRPAFGLETFFYKNELPNLDPKKVTKLNVILANDPKLAAMPGEVCVKGSLKLLEEKVAEKGVKDGKQIPFFCEENPPNVVCLFQS